jgi:predicted transcriptional regulator
VSSYDFWPARWFARRAARRMARKHGLEIWLDWKGELKKALSMRDDISNVVVLDAEGRERFRHPGKVPDVAALVTLVRSLAKGGS